jgi:phage baseplate assembly protein W
MISISHLHWQHNVQLGGIAAWNTLVVGLDDLHQAIRIIVLTPKLSVPTEPEKFCDALDYIDRPPAIAIPNITREIWDALAKWEPRIVVETVEVTQLAFEHFKAKIQWRPVEAVLSEIQQTDIILQEAA